MTEQEIAKRVGADRVALDTQIRSHDEAEIRLTAHWGDVQHAVVWGVDLPMGAEQALIPELAITAMREWAVSKGLNIGAATA